MENKSIRKQVVEMEVGQSLTFPLMEIGYTTIRTYASELGFLYNRIYTTSRNRTSRQLTITRTA